MDSNQEQHLNQVKPEIKTALKIKKGGGGSVNLKFFLFFGIN